MKTNLDTSILADLDFAFEPPCECDGHGKGYYFINGFISVTGHKDTGPARWTMDAICPACEQIESILVCDGKVEQIKSYQKMDRMFFTCVFCQAGSRTENWTVVFVPLGEKK